MDIFRSKKKDVDQAFPQSGQGLQKKRHGLSGSLDDLLDIGKDNDGGYQHFSENTASESEGDENDINKASKKQKAFAKMSIRWEKRKEKEQRKKTERNLISMDDFLGKQAEFKMWLYEEKSKNAGEMASPKLKAHFKQFVRLWNKKKLAAKYYRSSTLPASPAPQTTRKCNFLTVEPSAGESPLLDTEEPVFRLPEKETLTSPFVTFGKTPPKVLKSKMLQLFGPSKDIALLSVAPLGSPQVVNVAQENASKDVYLVPKAAKRKNCPSDVMDEIPRGPTPYKVSAYPWATKKADDSFGSGESVDICSTETPPRQIKQRSVKTDEDVWPPPSEGELQGARTHDSPSVPPPPPPRLESLQKSDCVTKSPKLAGNYADPYDTLPATQSNDEKREQDSSDYKDPVDCVPVKGQRSVKNSARLVLQSMSQNDEPDLSLYYRPLSEKRLSKEELEELYAKPLKRAKKNDIGSLDDADNDGKEEQTQDISNIKCDLYSEIMEHIKSSTDGNNINILKPDPVYESIDECLGKLQNEKPDEKPVYAPLPSEKLKRANDNLEQNELSSPKFATITKSKKMRVMAASTEKIYETYLSLGRKGNPLKIPKQGADFTSKPISQTMKAKCKSQPDISFSEGLHSYNIDFNAETDNLKQTPSSKFSSFKSKAHDEPGSRNFAEMKLMPLDRAKSCDDGLCEFGEPRTPIILATPSFDSLCGVTPLSYRSPSMQSLPHNKSGSYESLSGHSHMSTSTSSSLSFGPDEKSGSMQSLQSERSLSPVKEEDELRQLFAAVDKPPRRPRHRENSVESRPENQKHSKGKVENEDLFTVENQDRNKMDAGVSSDDVYKRGLMPLTPGKVSALKHGIDLSVYLLKPTKTEDSDRSKETEYSEKKRNLSQSSEPGSIKSTQKIGESQKLFETQSRLVIKETLSGLKTKQDQSGRSSVRKEIERRHTVQTMQEFGVKENQGPAESTDHADVDNGEERKMKSVDKQGEMKVSESHEPQSKRQCREVKRPLSKEDNYLETDLDQVLTDKPRKTMRKSKSHSGFEIGSSNVVTDIW